MIHNLRCRLKTAIKNNQKTGRTLDLIGCSIDELWIHLEKQFITGMTRENYGKDGWDIDHIIPCDWFKKNIDFSTDISDQKRCFHYTNLRPMWHLDNIKKGNKLTNENYNDPTPFI